MADAESRVYINQEELRHRVMNNAALYKRLLEKFKIDTAEAVGNIGSLAAAGEWEKAQAEAHTLKGVAANLSLQALFQDSLAAETEIKARGLKKESLEALKTCYNKTVAAIDAAIEAANADA